MDKAGSARAREEGNAHFRKGRWSDAAAAYARAGALDSSDAACWANRAQAMLKLEQYADALSDADTALARDRTHIKARFRRAVAKRALGDLHGARDDLQDVLRRDANNAVAGVELAEISEEIARKAEREAEEKKAEEKKAEESRKAETAAAEADEAKKAGAAREAATVPEAKAPAAAPKPAVTSSFAAMRKNRDTRPSYAPRTVPSAASAAIANPAPAPAPVPAAASRLPTTTPAATTPAPAAAPQPQPQAAAPTPTPAPAPKAAGPPPTPPNPSSTAPGAGLALLRALEPLPPAHRWAYLRHYVPGIVARIVAPVLEPDALGLLLSAVGGNDNMTDDDRAWALATLTALKATPRWRMNLAMLSRAEKADGARAWRAAGGEGPL